MMAGRCVVPVERPVGLVGRILGPVHDPNGVSVPTVTATVALDAVAAGARPRSKPTREPVVWSRSVQRWY